MSKEARRQGLRASIALDLTTGWDFRDPAQRQKARELVRKHRPAVLLLSPPCTTFSPLRRLSNYKRPPWFVKEEEAEGDDHLDFSNELAMEQMNEGRGFVLEQPKPATSWQRPSTLTLLDHPDVYRIYLDQCRFALRAHKGPFKGMLVRKPTCLATNIDGLADYLEKKCLNNHKHGMLLGGSAKEAAVYTPQLVQALMNGIKAALGLQVAKATSAPHPQSHQWLQWGRALGQIIRDQAEETVSIDREIEETYGKTTHAWPTEHEAEEDDAEDFDAVQALRKEMKTIEDQPRLKEALEKTETFQRVDDGAFSTSSRGSPGSQKPWTPCSRNLRAGSEGLRGSRGHHSVDKRSLSMPNVRCSSEAITTSTRASSPSFGIQPSGGAGPVLFGSFWTAEHFAQYGMLGHQFPASQSLPKQIS